MTGPLEDIHGMIAGEGQISDDLVNRARDCANGVGDFKTDRGDFGLLDDLADRIEKLEGQLAEAHALFDKINRTDAKGPRNLTEARWIARDGLKKTTKAD